MIHSNRRERFIRFAIESTRVIEDMEERGTAIVTYHQDIGEVLHLLSGSTTYQTGSYSYAISRECFLSIYRTSWFYLPCILHPRIVPLRKDLGWIGR